jgi:lipoate-protein ligase A
MSTLPASAVTRTSSLPNEANRQDACVTRLFRALEVYHDNASRSAAMNMAIDEALLESVTVPSLRLYRWDHATLSFGYFGKFTDVEAHARECELVRRWTGGGIVLHGDDLTYAIVIPAGDAAFAHSTMSIYEKVHEALRNALVATGQHAVVAAVADRGTGVNDAGYNGHCFANPVRADVLVNGQKVAGAAQRKTRAGLLQQGSIQHVDLAGDFAGRFVAQLASTRHYRQLNGAVIEHANEIAAQKYGTDTWLRKR